MGEVVGLKPRDRYVWACGDCGCTTFELFTDGDKVCANCGNAGDAGQWIDQLPDPVGEIVQTNTHTKVIYIPEAKSTLQQMMRKIDEDRVMALIAIETNGQVRTWGGITEADKIEWLQDCLANAEELLQVCVPKGDPK